MRKKQATQNAKSVFHIHLDLLFSFFFPLKFEIYIYWMNRKMRETEGSFTVYGRNGTQIKIQANFFSREEGRQRDLE